MEAVKTDVAIIGAGGAGLRAAIALAQADPKLRIALVSKVYPMRSHTCAAEGGAAGVIKPDDSLEHHFNDTVGGGDWLCDQDCGRVLRRGSAQGTASSSSTGAARGAASRTARWRCGPFGGMKKQRTWFAADKSGFHILHTLFQTSLQFDSIQRFDEYYATELLVDDGRCAGVVAIEMRSGQMRRFDASAVIIAGGGAGRMFPFTTNGAIKTGDGMALAYRAGVPLKDMEFVQYHPTGLPEHRHPAHRGLPRRGRRAASTRTAAASCRTTAWGRRRRSASRCSRPWSSARATASARRSGTSSKRATWCPRSGATAMLLDMRHLGEKMINERLPLVRDLSISYLGVDPVTDPVPVRPVVHYMMGGIDTDIKAATPLPGLFAAGECACVSINGANRLGSNSLTELLVFGRRAGAERRSNTSPAARRQRTRPRVEARGRRTRRRACANCSQRTGGTETVAGLRKEMMRHDGGECRHLPHRRGPRRRPARSSPTCASATAASSCTTRPTSTTPTCCRRSSWARCSTAPRRSRSSALARKESRGAHQRLDFADARRHELPAPLAGALSTAQRAAAIDYLRRGDHQVASPACATIREARE